MAEIEVVIGDDAVSWNSGRDQITVPQSAPPRSACFAAEPPCVIIVEESNGPSNAVVYDIDGAERVRLPPPPGDEQIGFDQVFVSRSGVVAVFAFRSHDKWGTPDLLTGEVPKWQEWR